MSNDSYILTKVARILAAVTVVFWTQVVHCQTVAGSDYAGESFNKGNKYLQLLISGAIEDKKSFQSGTLWNLAKIDKITKSNNFRTNKCWRRLVCLYYA